MTISIWPSVASFPVRFDSEGFEIRFGGRWHGLPFLFTALIISAICVALFWIFLHGPMWASIIAITIIVLPAAALVSALVWTGAQAYASWFVDRWYRLAIGFAVAIISIGLEFADVRWPNGEPLNGYFWGGMIIVFCTLAAIFGFRQRRLEKKSAQ